ncbi:MULTISPECIES: hypothetical protein [unclassified Nocardia]|uniref:hypothetical protein n=1 Tax=unclassified Nocardia TaxID=2637762 RepID=UPI00278BD235|nr:MULTISPECIES: hypothetical protein [unclassified Nocardia]
MTARAKTFDDLASDVDAWNEKCGDYVTVRRTASREGAAIIHHTGDLLDLVHWLTGRGHSLSGIDLRPQKPRVRVRIAPPTRFRTRR